MNEWINKWVKLFKDDLGEEVYNCIESESNLIGKRVQLRSNSEFNGIITCLWLPKDEQYRTSDLWCVDWDNGKFGIIEIKQIIFT
jgi:hypothetical protein